MEPSKRTTYQQKAIIIILLLGCLLLFSGEVGPSDSGQVVLQLKWKHQFQFAGYYAAIEKGYYRQAGLDVRLEEGGPQKDAIAEVSKGKAHYGVSNSQVLLHRIKGEPLVVLGVIFQHSPLVLVTRQSTGISSPQGMIGRRIRMTRDSRDVELHAALHNEGISLDQVNIMDGWVQRKDYFDPQYDAVSAYVTNEVYYYKEKNIPYQVINPLVYGIDFYGDCLITSEGEVDKHPERVEAFLDASLKGWAYAMDHPEELIDIIKKKYRSEKSRSHLRYEADAMRDLILPDLVELGHMNPGRWEHIGQTFARFGWIDPDFSLDGFLYNPTLKTNQTWIRWVWAGLSIFALIAGMISTVMFFYNRRLEREVADRKLAEDALRASESRLRQIIDLVPHFIFVKNRDGKFLLANQAVANFYGTNVEGLSDKTDADFHLSKAEFERFRSHDNRVLDEGRPLYISEEKTTDAAGRVRWLQTTKIPLVIPGTESKAVMGVATDITERKQSEKEKALLEDQLKQSQKMEAIGILAGGVAHDFNNLLQAISGYAQLLLLDKQENHPENRHITAILNSSDRAASLVRQLLLFSRKAETDRKPVDLNREVELAGRILGRTIPKMVKIMVQTDPDLRLINADTVQVELVLLNLGTNAADAMPEGGALTIKTENIMIDRETADKTPGLMEGHHVLLTVTDTGFGMEKAVLKKIFDPFYTTKDVGKGTGLGLASVYGVVKSHGGHIVCESQVNQGTVFRIYFPALNQTLPEETTERLDQTLLRGDDTILLVDDERQIRDFSSQMLASFGYHVLTAASGEEAIDIYSQKRSEVDLVILDIGMPGMGGMKCLDWMIEQTPSAKIIIASGYSDGQIKEAMRRGASAYVSKPYGMEDLLKNVRMVLEGRSKYASA